MRLVGVRSMLNWAVALFAAASFAGCDNPFDPLNTSDKIQGLAYFDFSASQEHWDSDPEWDGLAITMAYYNEFGDSLSFHDKSHKVRVELWTEVEGEDSAPTSLGTLLTSKTVDYSNSDDVIRIPIEFYGGTLELPSTEAISGCLLIRIYPPEEYPRKELYYITCGVELYTPEEAVIAP